jgi:hypothetical protein
MRNFLGKRGIAAGVILVLVLCLTLLAFSATAGAKTRARPFHGFMPGTVTFVPSADSPTGMFTISDAAGQVSHMGASVLYGKHPSAFDFAGDMSLTAANGDTILISYYGGGALPPNVGDWYDLWTVATIAGGTGRFAHVSGDIDMAVSLQFMGLGTPVWPAIFEFTGTIRY